jgi:hypothetical protein
MSADQWLAPDARFAGSRRGFVVASLSRAFERRGKFERQGQMMILRSRHSSDAAAAGAGCDAGAPQHKPPSTMDWGGLSSLFMLLFGFYVVFGVSPQRFAASPSYNAPFTTLPTPSRWAGASLSAISSPLLRPSTIPAPRRSRFPTLSAAVTIPSGSLTRCRCALLQITYKVAVTRDAKEALLEKSAATGGLGAAVGGATTSL